MAGVHTKGIILRKTNYGDNDLIFDVHTEEGKIVGFFARGARKIKSKFTGVIQLGHVVTIEYTTGKNLNYPNEITLDKDSLFSFYSRSIAGMNFYADLLTITRAIAKDFEDERLFSFVVESFKRADQGEDLTIVYNSFIESILDMIGVDTTLKCYFSGNEIKDKEFYYQPDANKVISVERKPKTIDLPLISFDEVFHKGYLKKLVLEHIHQKIALKF